LAQEGSAYDLNINMFNVLQRTITGWREENLIQMIPIDRASESSTKSDPFSPHPDDDVISMGGTFRN
jgi:glucosamine-6-phosphate deaminase